MGKLNKVLLLSCCVVIFGFQRPNGLSCPQRTRIQLAAKKDGDIGKAIRVGVASVLFSVFSAMQVNAIENAAAVGKCVLTECQLPLVKCLGNVKCAANLVCLQTCSAKGSSEEEIDCQIRCGDLFENEIVGEFNKCAVSQKKCVPKRKDDGSYPEPKRMVSKFNPQVFDGQWYISAGLNPIFDTFACQIHFFTSPPQKPDTIYGKLNWRIDEPDGEFFTRNTIQRFVQSSNDPGILINGDNEYLHYSDTWYIIDAEASVSKKKPNEDFILVYYRGSNDAWDGYGGAVLYTRTPYASQQILDRAAKSFDAAGTPYTFSQFAIPDNSCPSELPSSQKLLLKEKYASRLFLMAEDDIREEITNVRRNAVSTINADIKEVVQATANLERQAESFEKLIEKDIEKVESTVANDIVQVEKTIARDLTGGAKKIASKSK